MLPGVDAEIARYLRSGQYAADSLAWPGDYLTRARRAMLDLKTALIAEVRRRAASRPPPPAVAHLDTVAFTRRRVKPMVRGLFPRCEQEVMLGVLERSVVFLTPANITAVLEQARWLGTAWNLASLYLGSLNAEPLGDEAPSLLGLSEETTCYVSMAYFRDRFADVVVHEVAHIFHNCKRRTVGLPETRTREWLLEIAFRKRETFAYACEAFSRVVELGNDRAFRRRLLGELAQGAMPCDEGVDADEYVDILREAVEARNGWKRILARCAPGRRPTRTEGGAS
jgi:hypothetical protein